MGKSIKDWSKFSDNDLLQLLKEKQNELGRKIILKDLGNKNGLPSPSYLYKRFSTYSWNEILNLNNLSIINVKRYPNDKALENLKIYYNILGRVPTRQDFEENNWKPYYKYYHRNFNSFENACLKAGIIKQLSPSKQKRIDDSIEELKRIAYELNKCPTVKEYEKYKRKGLSRRTLEKNTVMKWNDICKKYIFEYRVNIDRDVTKKEIIRDIKYAINKENKVLNYAEYKKHSREKYSYTIFESVFNKTYLEILQDIGYKTTNTTTKSKCEEEMLDDFLKLFKELKRVPYDNDLNNSKFCVSSTTYRKYFKSIENVCKLLDIDYEKHYKGTGAGRICYDNLGQLCKSIPEKDISNYLIDKNINFKKETYYSDILINENNNPIKNNTRRFDWTIFINDKEYYVEYFGMYERNPRGHVSKKYTNNTRKKIKDLYKAGVIDKCIFIFPYDLKNKTLDEIFGEYIDLETNNKQKIS